MKLITALWLAMWLTPAAGQNSTVNGTGQIMTFSFPMDTGGDMHLSPTTLLPQAKGAATVVRGSIAIDIDIRLEDIPPAQSLGGNLNTYVVWLISPDGELRNMGELLMNGNTGMLQTTTNWGAFGIFVTAEPNNCVRCPTGPIVMANDDCVNGLPQEHLVTIVCRNPSSRCSDERISLSGQTQ